MKADQLQLALRPRPPWEAADLGVRLAQASAASLLRGYVPLWLLLSAASLATLEVAAWLPIALMSFGKPWLERGLLTLFARRVFGEETRFRDAWAARAAAPWGPLLAALTVGRFVPWRAFSAPVTQLEGQRGAARRRRIRQLAAGQRAPATLMLLVFGVLEMALLMGLAATLAVLTPGVDFARLGRALSDTGDSRLVEGLLSAGYAIAMGLVEPFFVAAGFALYLNRRVDLEAWDVEQDLREAFPQEPRA